ncbi:unnamed protein product [Phytophthora fragariaefolia]|uniref:Unnamed protein product n=1 Tax=Phytophthora fragariaefolia TaxID=1490495 RepID=A0A9W6Y8Y1_9STRA|nr:unnamed protein product [Phytophthora fragariaefolia]
MTISTWLRAVQTEARRQERTLGIHWSNDEAYFEMAYHLEGEALWWYGNIIISITDGTGGNLARLFRDRYGEQRSDLEVVGRLNDRKQMRGEPLVEYAAVLRTIVTDRDISEEWLNDAFLNGMGNPDSATHVRGGEPATLDDAVRMAAGRSVSSEKVIGSCECAAPTVRNWKLRGTTNVTARVRGTTGFALVTLGAETLASSTKGQAGGTVATFKQAHRGRHRPERNTGHDDGMGEFTKWNQNAPLGTRGGGASRYGPHPLKTNEERLANYRRASDLRPVRPNRGRLRSERGEEDVDTGGGLPREMAERDVVAVAAKTRMRAEEKDHFKTGDGATNPPRCTTRGVCEAGDGAYATNDKKEGSEPIPTGNEKRGDKSMGDGTTAMEVAPEGRVSVEVGAVRSVTQNDVQHAVPVRERPPEVGENPKRTDGVMYEWDFEMPKRSCEFHEALALSNAARDEVNEVEKRHDVLVDGFGKLALAEARRIELEAAANVSGENDTREGVVHQLLAAATRLRIIAANDWEVKEDTPLSVSRPRRHYQRRIWKGRAKALQRYENERFQRDQETGVLQNESEVYQSIAEVRRQGRCRARQFSEEEAEAAVVVLPYVEESLRSIKGQRRRQKHYDYHSGSDYEQPVVKVVGPKPNCTKRLQRDVAIQLAVTLEWYGAYGNGNAVAHFVWQQKLIESSAYHEERFGLVKCVVSFVDGTHVILDHKPHINGALHYNRKCRNSFNVPIVCNEGKVIVHAFTGWPGSCCDSTVFSKTPLAQHPEQFFSGDQYRIGDTSYTLSTRLITPYKLQAASKAENAFYKEVILSAHVLNENWIDLIGTAGCR